MIKAIIFDKDGTLVDTEKHFLESYLEACRICACPITREQALGFRSLGKPFVYDYTKEITCGKLTWNDIRPLRTKIYLDIISKQGVELKPYAEEALKELKEKGCILAVATASNTASAKEQLESVGILKYFDRILSAHDVPEGKPSPDVYIEACRQLGLNPDETIAIEDSPNGALSAVRAGCKTVMIPDLTEPDEELRKKLFAVKSNLLELTKLV
jgi:HAD superfamily hydrolase (TIGR01509 family)